ncbi:condensation domain-containing protein [Mycolicibacterium monacense]|uniref:Fatty acyl-AMP ligase FadD28 and polyketide synthase n=2 Tax=Mycobacteriaceae TaxID=1762 RepID=A0AAD1MYP6_MYCMB|nr:hypothetical protein [Mycolicibacterium monacense]MDA4102072.1 hypothetical protein [Mycolicibacterium monacense DSM 44395]OBB74902.1 hypothetical protein A6B34_14155 [Mycolicibacterium monacense]OBF52453.1 hypothetical protein A5778_15100 [Mycolicibacterium monacense]ORB20011.1 hypothetical protein BST34_13680 [Mycolicibacterium monacense DSM 44395]QHP86814.1 hypothetical protein EWR22_16455 [Mycolicibacterium monacense DSM 44395]
MAIQMRPATLRAGRGEDGGLRDDHLAYIDQAAYLQQRATGVGKLAQAVWVYEHPLNMDALKRFHANLDHSLIGRRVETSVLPFGRHRWVSAEGAPIAVSAPRSRADLSDWIDERSAVPIDPEIGPSWHLGVLPMDDGSVAISLAASHVVTDGIGLLRSIADAAEGRTRHLGYAPARSRSTLTALRADLRQTARDMPEVGRTVAAAAKLAYRRRHELRQPASPRAAAATVAEGGKPVIIPAITAFIDAKHWDSCAEMRNGTTYSLLAGFAARLAERTGRHRPDDGAVSLLIAISERTPDDTRANAVAITNACVDPARVTADLSESRIAIRQAITTLREVPDETFALLPLNPFVPKRAVKRAADIMFGDLPVSCSNLGEIDPAVGRVDGTDAEYFMLRGVDQNLTREQIERAGGQLVVASVRLGDMISLGIVSYEPGRTNTKRRLRDLTTLTLAEFDLYGEIV